MFQSLFCSVSKITSRYSSFNRYHLGWSVAPDDWTDKWIKCALYPVGRHNSTFCTDFFQIPSTHRNVWCGNDFPKWKGFESLPKWLMVSYNLYILIWFGSPLDFFAEQYEGIYEVLNQYSIRSISFNGLNKTTADRIIKMRPMPTNFVIFARPTEMTELIQNVLNNNNWSIINIICLTVEY